MANPTQHLPTGADPNAGNWAPGRGQDATPVTKVNLLIEYAQRYKLRRLVETGLYVGGGSGMGVVAAGVIAEQDYVIIDWQESNCEMARASHPRASVYQGDSAVILPRVLEAIDRSGEPALWWLDAHGIEIDIGFPPCPLFAELDALHASPLAHVVLVDDLHMMGGHDWPSLAQLRGYADGSKWEYAEASDIMRLTPGPASSVAGPASQTEEETDATVPEE